MQPLFPKGLPRGVPCVQLDRGEGDGAVGKLFLVEAHPWKASPEILLTLLTIGTTVSVVQ